MGVEISLKGKHAVVTGGGAGMGRKTALIYGQAGADVLICDINTADAEATSKEIRELYGVRTGFCRCDVSQVADIKAAMKMAADTFGSIDIVANIAGIFIRGDFLDCPEQDFDRQVAINERGTFFVDQEAIRYMKETGGGKIINMCSMSGVKGFGTSVAYSATKFAVNGITKAAADYAAKYNICVNCVCPGLVANRLWEKAMKEFVDGGGNIDDYWKERTKGIPLGRTQTEEDVAGMFLYLASAFADNITGQAVNINGGQVMG